MQEREEAIYVYMYMEHVVGESVCSVSDSDSESDESTDDRILRVASEMVKTC